jgi:hypothetical protein
VKDFQTQMDARIGSDMNGDDVVDIGGFGPFPSVFQAGE